MKTETCTYDIVRFRDGSFELEINVSPKEETVWLSKNDIALLFERDRSVISRHIRNVFKEHECDEKSNVHFLHVANSDKPVEYYNLEVVISVGYRVKSKRGVIFRRWASSVLKQYMLKGYSIDSSRVLVTQENYINLVNVVNRIDNHQQNLTKRVEKLEIKNEETRHRLFFRGQLYDATSCIEGIIAEAKKSVVLIDNYVDKRTLDIISKKKKDVSLVIVTSYTGLRITETEIQAFNVQYGGLSVQYSEEFHDRFLVLDNSILYHCGASIKDAGKRTFGITLIEDEKYLKSLLDRLN